MPLSPPPVRPAPRLLVSVRDSDEAVLACAAGAGIVDAKDPDGGPLDPLPAATVRAIVARVAGRAPTSAVAEADSVAAMAATGVDYVKLALRRGDAAGLTEIAGAAPGRAIAVLFAEDGAPADLVRPLAAAGFCGAMIDTRGKSGHGLPDCLPVEALAAFVTGCRDAGLLCGLAGSLRVADIPALARLRPDYLGFRGGLCRGGDRRGGLDGARVRAAARAIRAAGGRDAAAHDATTQDTTALDAA